MNYYFITGTSRGIGKAITENLLTGQDNYVIGFSRTCSVKHERYEHIQIDLIDIESVKNYRFINIIDAQSITLINNSGMLGEVNHIGNIDNQSIIDVFNLNTIAPAVLINSFINSYQHLNIKKQILNISSGAGKHAIESWGPYCASKSALDMFSEVVFKEQSYKSKQSEIKIFSVAPGIVDTQMQAEIRKTDKNNFSLLETFINYKKDNLLASANETAVKLIKFLNQTDNFLKPVLDLREMDLI